MPLSEDVGTFAEILYAPLVVPHFCRNYVALVPRMIGLWIARHAKVEILAQTVLGKIALLRLNPFDVALQSAGIIVAIWGVWIQTTVVILSGLSLIVVGHGLEWEKVHPALGLEQET